MGGVYRLTPNHKNTTRLKSVYDKSKIKSDTKTFKVADKLFVRAYNDVNEAWKYAIIAAAIIKLVYIK